MEVSEHFDGAFGAPVDIDGATARFDMSEYPHVLDVRVSDLSGPVEVVLDYAGDDSAETEREKAQNQGLLAASDDGPVELYPLAADGPRLRATVPPDTDWLGTRFHYGRDDLDELLCAVADAPVDVRYRERDGRGFPEFHFGDADAPLVHYVVAGEDAIETNGQLLADRMVRTLLEDDALRERLTDGAAIRVAPLVTPYSATAITTARVRSYVTPDGDDVYGAATYNDPNPPPEYGMVRDALDELIADSRLGLFLTIHGHGGMTPFEFETIATAGDRELSDGRREWAARTMVELHRGIDGVQTDVPEEIWYAGLARDYTLREHGVATFRLEARSHAEYFDGPEYFWRYAETFLENLSAVEDWSGAYPDADR